MKTQGVALHLAPPAGCLELVRCDGLPLFYEIDWWLQN
jgi:hypothetical protein